jgi:O-antigen ligase
MQSMTLRRSDVRLSTLQQVAIGLVVVICVGLSQLKFPSWIFTAVIVGAMGALALLNDGKYCLHVLAITVAGLLIKPVHSHSQTTIFDVLGAVVIGGITLGVILRQKLQSKRLMHSPLEIMIACYLAWTVLCGIGGMIWWTNNPNNLLRELSLQIPIFIVPILVMLALKDRPESERGVFILFLVLWIGLCILNFIQLRNNISTAVYLWQTGRSTTSTSAAIYLFLMCVSFLMYYARSRVTKYIIAIGILSLACIAISHYRSLWLGTLAGVPMMFYASNKEERRVGLMGVTKALLVLLALVFVLFVTIPLFRLLVLLLVDRFASASKGFSDRSLYNRVVESRYLWSYFVQAPLTGYGYGATWLIYDWLLGIHVALGYTHNGYLYTLGKSGVVGFVLLFGAYFGYLIQGISVARSKLLTPLERALVRGGLGYQFATLVSSYALNSFGDRSDLTWLGLSWGFVLLSSHKIRVRSQQPERLEASTAELAHHPQTV